MLQFLAHELIFEILRHFLPGLRLKLSERSLVFPWYLGGICSSWRTVFISSPQFWSALDICVDPYCVQPSQELLRTHHCLLDLIQLALKRSDGHPLTLSVAMDYTSYPDDPTASLTFSKNILEVLVTHSVYWREAHLAIPLSLWSVLYGAKGRLPILRSINFRIAGGSREEPADIIYDLFMDADQLTRICMDHIPQWRINWSCMTVIHFQLYCRWGEIISVLRQTSVLKELAIYCGFDTMNNNTPPVHLPFLKVLYIQALGYLSLFHAPGLEELYIRWVHSESDHPDALQFFKTIVSNYFSTIHCLRKLAIDPQSTRDALLILEEAPSSTQHLLLHEEFEFLKYVTKYPPLWNLKAISITTYSHEIPQLLAIVRTWAQRKQAIGDSGIGPLKNLVQFSLTFTVTYAERDMFKSVVESLKRVLEERGINFVSKTIKDSFDGIPFGLKPVFNFL